MLSASVSNALQYYNDDDTFETERFVRLFDRFFDCLNTRHPDAGFHARKPDLNPYRTTKDTRLTVYIYSLALFQLVHALHGCSGWRESFLGT